MFYIDQLVHLLICLVCWETKVVRTLFSGKTVLGVAFSKTQTTGPKVQEQ